MAFRRLPLSRRGRRWRGSADAPWRVGRWSCPLAGHTAGRNPAAWSASCSASTTSASSPRSSKPRRRISFPSALAMIPPVSRPVTTTAPERCACSMPTPACSTCRGEPRPAVWRPLISAVFGHHGTPPVPRLNEGIPALRADYGRSGIEAARMFVHQAHALFPPPPELPALDRSGARRGSFLLAGIAVLADWIRIQPALVSLIEDGTRTSRRTGGMRRPRPFAPSPRRAFCQPNPAIISTTTTSSARAQPRARCKTGRDPSSCPPGRYCA